MMHLGNSTTCVSCGNSLACDYAITDGGMLAEVDVPAVGIACIGVILECGWCRTEYSACVSLEHFTLVERAPLQQDALPQFGVRQ